MKNLLIFAFIFVFIACSHRNSQLRFNDSESIGQNSLIMSLDTVAWSKWTPEQQELYKKLNKTMAQYLKNEDGRLKFDMTEVEFISIGLPDSLYSKLINELKYNDHYLDSIGTSIEERTKMNEEYLNELRRISE